MTGEIFGPMFLEESLDKLRFIASAKIPVGDMQNAACFSRRKPDRVGEVGVSRDEKGALGQGKNGFVKHSAFRMFGDRSDFVA